MGEFNAQMDAFEAEMNEFKAELHLFSQGVNTLNTNVTGLSTEVERLRKLCLERIVEKSDNESKAQQIKADNEKAKEMVV